MMARKSDINEDTWRLFTTLDSDVERRTYNWLHGGMGYLQGSRQEFVGLLYCGEKKDYGNTGKSDPAELIETVKKALAKGELGIAESYSIKAIRTAMFDNSCKKSLEPYRFLAEVLQRKAEDKNLQLQKRQLFLLQAAALYNFALNYLKTEDVEDELSKTLTKVVSRKLFDIQDTMVEMVGGNPLYCKFDPELKKKQLKNLRDQIKQSFESMECRLSSNNTQPSNKCDMRQMMNDLTEEIKRLSDTISVKMKEFLTAIINECLELLGTPPCYYEVIVLGSLARNEMTPYSDFEWAILTESEEEKCKVFFRNLTNLVHLQIINLGETILPSMNIKEINEEWFYDDKTAKGISFDGFLPQACKTPLGNTPLGNTPEFELIHTPQKMADFQSNDWYRKNWKLADTLLTVSPLQTDKHILVDAYREEMTTILSCPCDAECCEHEASYGACLTRGSCRGMRTLCEDVSRYGDLLTGNNTLDDGKFYDVKKEIYRITDRVFSALAKCYNVEGSGTFAILDELYKREIILSEAKDNFESASAIAIKLRIGTYLKAGKQGEQFMASSNEETENLKSVFFLPNNVELFHFFFIAIPLYEELQKLETAGNVPPSLTHSSFYDDSDVTVGDIHCRLLNYDEALKCYDRTLGLDPENLSIEIRKISITLCITKSTEEMDKIRNNLDALLCKINQSWSEPNRKTIQFASRLNFDEMRQLLELLLLASLCFGCHEYYELVRNILSENATKIKYGNRRNIQFALMLVTIKGFPNSELINAVTSNLLPVIDEEGVSTRGILWLNTLGEFFYAMDEHGKAYHCFQRALSMERLLYQTKPNMNMMTSLFFLGLTASMLLMNKESKFYFESFVQLFESFGKPDARVANVKMAYYLLARISRIFENCAEECEYYASKGLKETTGSPTDREFHLDSGLYSQLAHVWHAEHKDEEASESVLKGKTCLRNIVEVNERVSATCTFVENLVEIQRINEGIEILKEEVQVFGCPTHQKALCLMKLGKLCVEQGLASDAENYYKQALEILVGIQNNADDVLECFIGMSKAFMMNNRVSEAKNTLNQALDLAIKLHASSLFFCNVGLFCMKLAYITSARQWFEEGLRSCKGLSDVATKPPFIEISLAVMVGKLEKDFRAIDSVNPETVIQVQRSYFDRAAKILRQHVATQEVVSVTVNMFLLVAEAYESVDKSETIRLLLEALDVSEKVYGKDMSNEMVINIFKKLSYTYFEIGELKNCIKYSELEIRMEIDLHLSNPFNSSFSDILAILASSSLKYSVSIDVVELAYEFLLSAQEDMGLRDITAKTLAARCFTSLGIMFYTLLSDLEKAETSIEIASQLFNEIQESVERKKLVFKVPCEIMKDILSSKKILPSDKKKISESLLKETRICFALEQEDILAEDSNAHLDALERNPRKGDVHQAAKILPFVKARELSLNENYDSYDAIEKRISDAIRAKENNDLSSCISFLDSVLQLASNWKQKTKILKLRAECYLSRGDFRSAAINFNEAVRVYSNETVRSRDDMCEYLEVVIGLIKAEMLCQNVAIAFYRYCVVAVQLMSLHEHEEFLPPQVLELHYLGAKCLYILLENICCKICCKAKEIAETGYAKLLSVCQQVVLLYNELKETSVEKPTKYLVVISIETCLLAVAVLRKLNEKEKACKILERIELGSEPLSPKSFRRLYINTGRVLLQRGETKQSITWLNESLLAFFSGALPDMLSFYEEFLHLMHAITVTKYSGSSSESRSPFQQAVDMCKDVLVKQGKDVKDVYEFLKTLATLYMVIGRTEEAIVVAETGLEICDFMVNNNDIDQINNRSRMLLYLAQMHQLNSKNSAFDREKELRLTERYYLIDQDSAAEFALQKNLSYANFLCEQKRFAEADTVLQDMNNLGEELSNKSVYCTYVSRVFYGPGIQKSVEIDGELLSSVNHCMYSTMVRVFVGIGKKREAVAACEKLADNPVVVHNAIYGKRPSSIPYLIEACHRELLSLLSDGDQKRFQNCELPLSAANIFELYYRLNEYFLALKYYPDETQSPELIEMRFSCLRLAGNELVELDRRNESCSYFTQFLEMLQTKEGFLDKPFDVQCATLAGYSFANQYYIFRSLGYLIISRGGNLDGAIQCHERCLELVEDLTLGQSLVATLADLYQSKALTVDIENQDFCKQQMSLALDLFQKLLQKNAELEPFVECAFGLLLLKLERYDEAFKHLENVIKRPVDVTIYYFGVDKPLVDVCLRREIEASGSIRILVKVVAFYELILTYMKLNGVGKAQQVALQLENYVLRFKRVPENCLLLSIVGYANKVIGNKQKAAEIFLSVLKMKPGHLPIAEALESLCL